MSDILTVAQAAAYLQVSDDVLYPLMVKGELPAGKVKGQWRLVREDLVSYIRAQYKKPGELCLTEGQGQASGGSSSAEYDSLLGLTTRKTPRRSKSI